MTTDERIEKKLTAQGVDVQSDEGASKLQREIERVQARRASLVGGVLAFPSDFTAPKRERVRGIMV